MTGHATWDGVTIEQLSSTSQYRLVFDKNEHHANGISNRLSDDAIRTFRFATISVPFFTLPCTPVLIHRIAGLDVGQATWADKDPHSRFIDPNAVKNIVRPLAAFASFRTDTLDRQLLASLLVRTTKSAVLETSQGDMLGLATGCSGSPQSEGRRLEFPSHQRDHLAGRQTELLANGVEARPILPCHLDDTI